MSWLYGPLAMFDVETTGVDPHRDRIVTAALITREPDRSSVTRDWLLNPGIPIPAAATSIHGISTEYAVTHGAPAAESIVTIAGAVLAAAEHSPIIGHNVSFDLTMLWCETQRHGRPDLADQIAESVLAIDTMVLDKWADPYRPKEPTKRRRDPATCGSRNLLDTCRVWGVALDERDAHGASADALAAGRLAWRIATKHQSLQYMHLAALQDFQAREKVAQATGLADWFRKQGKDAEADSVSFEWPIQGLPQGWAPEQVPAA